MQFCQDGDIYKKIRNTKKKFPEKKITNWMAQLIISIHYLHSKKILHRDLKTQNIFLNKNRLFLGDFGISKTLENTRELANTYIGTPYYMSPELFNYKPYSYKSDIWSLGCVLYEICNLKHAFNAQTINGLAMKILKGNYVPICKIYSKGLREFIDSLLVTDPRLRPSIKKITQIFFVKKIISKYFINLVLKNDLSDFEIDSVKGQILKIGLSHIIKEEIKDFEEIDKKKVFDFLLSKRDLELVKKELVNYKDLKEIELLKENERKEKLENEMERLRLKKDNLGSKNNFESKNVFKKKKWNLEVEEESYKDDYEDFEFPEDNGDNNISEEMLNTKISEFNNKLKDNSLLIQKIKKEINETIDKINNPEKELFEKDVKEEDNNLKKENENLNPKNNEENIKDSEKKEKLFQLNEKEEKSEKILEQSQNNSINHQTEIDDSKVNYSESKKSNLSDILKSDNEYFYSTNEFEDSKSNIEDLEEKKENFEDFKIVNVLKEKIKDLNNKIYNGLGKNLYDKIFGILDFEICKDDFEIEKILDVIGKENIGYCHLVEQYVYFSQELMELKNNDN